MASNEAKKHRSENGVDEKNTTIEDAYETPTLRYWLPSSSRVVAGVAAQDEAQLPHVAFIRASPSHYIASGTSVDALPALAIVTSDGAVHWFAVLPRGFAYARFDGTLQGVAASVLSASTVQSTGYAHRVVLAIATTTAAGQAQKHVLALSNSTATAASFGRCEVPEPCSSVAIVGDTVAAASASSNAVYLFDLDMSSGTWVPKPPIKFTPAPVVFLSALSNACLAVVDGRGVIEVVDSRTWSSLGQPAAPGKGVGASSAVALPHGIAWARKMETDLFGLLKRGCVAIHNVACCGTSGTLAIEFEGRRVGAAEGAPPRWLWVASLLTGKELRVLPLEPRWFEEGVADTISLEALRRNQQQPGLRGLSVLSDGKTIACATHAGLVLVDTSSMPVTNVRYGLDAAVAGDVFSSPVLIDFAVQSTQAIRDVVASISTADHPECAAAGVMRCVVAGFDTAASGQRGVALFGDLPGAHEPKLPPIPNYHPTFQTASAAGGAGRANLVAALRCTIETSLGSATFELFPAEAPKAVHNFATLAREGYYDGLIFHRVIKGFMIQGGCPRGDGTGGRSAFGGAFEDEVSSGRKMDLWCLCMANAGPDTNQSQFFITTGAAPWLQGKHTIFGSCVDGIEVLRSIENVPCGPQNRPYQAVKIKHVRIDA